MPLNIMIKYLRYLPEICMAGTSREPNPNPDQSTSYDDSNMMKPYEFFFNRFPRGFKFQPSDEELILRYLTNKLLNKPLPTRKILDLNLYNFSPMQLAEMHKFREEEEMYFFSPRDRKYPNGKLPSRTTGDGNGFWKATGKDKVIRNERLEVTGTRKTLVFHEGKPKHGEKKTDWIMHEFIMEENILPTPNTTRAPGDNRLDDWVLCKVYPSKMSKSKPITEDEEETEMTGSMSLEQDFPVVESSATPNLVELVNLDNASEHALDNGFIILPSTTDFEAQEQHLPVNPVHENSETANLGEQVNLSNASVQALTNGFMPVPYGSATCFLSQEQDHPVYESSATANLREQVHVSNASVQALTNGFMAAPYGSATDFGSQEMINLGARSDAHHQQNLPSFSQLSGINSVSSAITSLVGGDNNSGTITTLYNGPNGSEMLINLYRNVHADHQKDLPSFQTSSEPSAINSVKSAIDSLAGNGIMPDMAFQEMPQGFGAQNGANVPPTSGIPAYPFPHGIGPHQSLPSFNNDCLPPLPQCYDYYDDLGVPFDIPTDFW